MHAADAVRIEKSYNRKECRNHDFGLGIIVQQNTRSIVDSDMYHMVQTIGFESIRSIPITANSASDQDPTIRTND